MATPVLEDLRKMYPGAKIVALCSGVLGELLEGNPYVDEVTTFSRKRRFFPEGLISKLRKERYDLGVLLTHSFSSAWHFWIGGVKKRVGFYKRWRAFLLSKSVDFPAEQEHLVLTYKRLIGPFDDSSPGLFIPSREKKWGKTLVGINPGAAYGSAKCWPLEKFREVIQRWIAEVPNSEIYVFGDKHTKALVDEICQGLHVHNLAGKTTLKELVQEIGRLDVFLTNDSGPMHIAASLKVPLVAIFGSTNPHATGPYKWGKVIYKGVSCSPCYKRECPIDFPCMKEVTVDEVVKEMKRALLVPALNYKREALSFQGAKEPVCVKESPALKKHTGVIILAAGMGRRLGLTGPKGCLEIQGESLYEILLKKVTGRCAIMTSPATYGETKKFLERKGFGHIDLFQERCLPRLSEVYEESPEGNGALFSTFYGSDLWKKWEDVDEICVLPIDNPLAEPLSAGDVELSIVAIEKRDGEEKLGALMEKEGRIRVCEYMEIPSEEKTSWSIAYSGMFACKKTFFEKAAKRELPWHLVSRNGVKHFEKFVFDAFPLAHSYQIILKKRELVFAPIKTKEDLVYYTSRKEV